MSNIINVARGLEKADLVINTDKAFNLLELDVLMMIDYVKGL